MAVAQVTYKPKQFNLSGLQGISDETLEMHFKLYEGYVTNTNKLTDELSEMVHKGETGTPAYAEMTRALGFEYNGMILHEYYFSNLKSQADPRPAPSSKLSKALIESFGSVEQWQSDFHAIGGLRGVGWVLLCQDPVTHRLNNYWVTLHHIGVPVSFKPLLVMDVWEHAFMRDYKATERGRYIEAFFRNVDWKTVERRLLEPVAIRPAAAA